MGQKKQTDDAVYFDSRYLDAHLKYKDATLQRKKFSNEIYRLAGFCKYLSLVLLAIGAFLLLLSIAYSSLSRPVQAKNVTSRVGEEIFSPELERAIIERTEKDSAANIGQQVSIFETEEVGEHKVTTGFRFSPPYDDGLGEPTAVWCYAEIQVGGKTRTVYFNIPYLQADADILTRTQFNQLKSGCRNR